MIKEGFKILNTQIIFEYKINPGIRRRVFDFEDKLGDFFKVPFRTIPVPDSVDPKIPRFESESIHGHSLLQVSGTRLVMKTNYSEEFQLDSSRIQSYIKERAIQFEKLLSGEEKFFIAYIIGLGFQMPEKDINKFLTKTTGTKLINSNTIDFGLNYSFPFLNKYFLNIKCSKYIQENINIQDGKVIHTGIRNSGISVNIDINSRLYHQNTSKFDDSLLNEISGLVFSLVNKNDLTNYLTGQINE